MKADARKRDVFQVCDPAMMPFTLLPENLHQFRT
jgi:hypothetical protein